jgi:thiol-disulfide isomerase/thioredoxin
MKLFSIIVFMCLSVLTHAQNNFTLRGHITLLSKSKSLIVSGPSGQFTAPIQKDGSFDIRGKLEEEGLYLIKTDSSVSDRIWLEPGNYILAFKEVTVDGQTGYFLRTPRLKGPKAAEISNEYTQKLYGLAGKNRDESKKNIADFSNQYLDSIIRNYPKSKVLPHIIASAQPFIGDEATKVYQTLLDEGQKTDLYSNGVENYFKRKDKIAKEKVFEDFQMKKDDGTTFQLSSVNKKLILIDFWSSDCAPCRRKHLEYVDLYAKYASKGLEIISISLDYNDKEWRKAMLKDKMSWINVSELKGWKTSLAQHYFVNSIPFTLWLDKDKNVLQKDLTEAEISSILGQ